MRLSQEKQLKIIIHFALYEMMKIFEESNFFSASNIKISEKGDSVKVYLNFVQPEETEKILAFLKKNNHYFKRKIAESHRFSRIPWISFFSDKQLEIT